MISIILYKLEAIELQRTLVLFDTGIQPKINFFNTMEESVYSGGDTKF